MTTCEVLRAGPMTTVQDWPGRLGYWKVGVPPSGPMDDLSFRLANLAVGNPEGAAGLEATLAGPSLRFDEAVVVAVTGAPVRVTIAGRVVPQWVPLHVAAGEVLDVGAVGELGMRVYIAIAGGIGAQEYLGSRATFTLGRFGGHDGRVLVDGDTLSCSGAGTAERAPRRILSDEQPALSNDWQLAVTMGPHGAPEFFTDTDIDDLLGTAYEVHFNSDRTGIRLIGPQPRWARADGGEATREFLNVVARSRPAIQKCYEQALKKNNGLQAKTVTLSVEANFTTTGQYKSSNFAPSLGDGYGGTFDQLAEHLAKR